jgi:hypothetical protein
MDSSYPAAAVRFDAQHAIRRRIIRALAVLALLAGVLVIDPGPVEAHNWDGWHWNRGGSKVDMYVWDQTGGCANGSNATNNALYDIYYNPHPIYIYCVNTHTDISLWEANEPNANFCGLAEVWGNYTNQAGQLHITHAHARTNTACGTSTNWKQGVHCQEVGHTLGLDHSDTGDCMGISYFPGSNGKYMWGKSGAYVYDWDHQTNDLYNRYRWHTPH